MAATPADRDQQRPRPIRVHLLMSASLREWRERDVPGQAPYGLEWLVNDGRYEVAQWAPPRWLSAVGLAVLFRKLESALGGTALLRPLLAARHISSADVSLAVLEQQGVVYALLRRAGIGPWSKVPLITVSCWQADESLKRGRLYRAVQRRVVSGTDRTLYFSSNQSSIFSEVLGAREGSHAFVPFGIELDFYGERAEPSAPAPEPFVLSVGLDRGRDFRTLLDAAGRLDVPFKLACPPDRLKGLVIPGNVELLGLVSSAKYRELLQSASAVMVVSHPGFAYPTGQTVVLNAMACGTPVIVTESPALADYVQDGVNCVGARLRTPRRLLRARSACSTIPDSRRRSQYGPEPTC